MNNESFIFQMTTANCVIPWCQVYNNSERIIRTGDYHWCIEGLTYSAPAASQLHLQWNATPLSQAIAARCFLDPLLDFPLHPQQIDTLYHDLTRTERYSAYIYNH